MQRLEIPPRLKQEFATVEALWMSHGETRRVDSLILSWVKHEKQLRRLFCFLVFQHPKISDANIDAIIGDLAGNGMLYPRTFVGGIQELGAGSIPELLGSDYKTLASEISRIGKYRNKLIHGQITGQNIQSPQIERDVLWIVRWIAALASVAESRFGYDGLGRDTYRMAKKTGNILVANYPFAKPTEFKAWLTELAKKYNKL